MTLYRLQRSPTFRHWWNSRLKLVIWQIYKIAEPLQVKQSNWRRPNRENFYVLFFIPWCDKPNKRKTHARLFSIWKEIKGNFNIVDLTLSLTIETTIALQITAINVSTENVQNNFIQNKLVFSCYTAKIPRDDQCLRINYSIFTRKRLLVIFIEQRKWIK